MNERANDVGNLLIGKEGGEFLSERVLVTLHRGWTVGAAATDLTSNKA